MNVVFQSFDSKRKFGVELEVNGKFDRVHLARVIQSSGIHNSRNTCVEEWGYTCNNTYWVVKPDSTCGDQGTKALDGGGFEAVSPAAIGHQHLLDIALVAEKLRDAGAVV